MESVERMQVEAGPSLAPSDDAERQRRERRRHLMRSVRQGLLGLLILLGAVGALLALRPRPVPVDAAAAVRGPLVVAIEETGTTRVKDSYLVSAPVSGTISRQTREPGDRIDEGEVLAEIAPLLSPLLDERSRSEARARLSAAVSAEGQARAHEQRARSALQLAEQELGRATALAAGSSISAQALERASFEARMRTEEVSSALFAVKVAAEQVRLARATLAGEGSGASRERHVDVRAPASGRLLRVVQKSAGVVQAGAPLLWVGNPEALEVVVDLLTSDAVQVHPGTRLTLHGWGGESPLAAQVRRIEPSAFTKLSALGVEEQRVNVIAALSDPPARWAALGDGFRVEARLVLWQADDVLKVPLGSAFRRGDGWAVFRLEGGVAHLQPVQLGHRGETEVELTQGLSPGDRVAVHPGDRVKDGARVEER